MNSQCGRRDLIMVVVWKGPFLKQALNSLLLKDSSSQKNSKMMFKFATFRNLKLSCNTERLLYNGQD